MKIDDGTKNRVLRGNSKKHRSKQVLSKPVPIGSSESLYPNQRLMDEFLQGSPLPAFNINPETPADKSKCVGQPWKTEKTQNYSIDSHKSSASAAYLLDATESIHSVDKECGPYLNKVKEPINVLEGGNIISGNQEKGIA